MIVHCAGPRLSNDVMAIHRIPRTLGCEPNFLRGPLPRRITRMRGEIAAGNVSCGMGAGVPSIEVTANEAELKNASRMFRPTMPDAVSKSRTGISNFSFWFGLRGHSPPAGGLCAAAEARSSGGLRTRRVCARGRASRRQRASRRSERRAWEGGGRFARRVHEFPHRAVAAPGLGRGGSGRWHGWQTQALAFAPLECFAHLLTFRVNTPVWERAALDQHGRPRGAAVHDGRSSVLGAG
jgi:hypothetical protein